MSVYMKYFLKKTEITTEQIRLAFENADLKYPEIKEINPTKVSDEYIIPPNDSYSIFCVENGEWFYLNTTIDFDSEDDLKIKEALSEFVPKSKIATCSDDFYETTHAWFTE